MTQVTQVGLGNTYTKPVNPRGRKWCLTINNYTKEYFDTLTQIVSTNDEYIFGKEGEEKTPHIQGYIHFKNAVSFSSMKKKFPTAHIEKAKGSKLDNYKYCSKEGNFISNMDFSTPQEKIIKQILDSEYKDVKWKDWQKNILVKIEEPPDKRKIHWYWEPTGNVGKSYLCKYIVMKYNVIIADGKKDNIFHSIFKMINEEEKIPAIIILDIPRTNMEYVNYGAIEQIKNGCIFSGKYEGGTCIFPIPIVIVLGNRKPEKYKLSEDRWDIVEISGK